MNPNPFINVRKMRLLIFPAILFFVGLAQKAAGQVPDPDFDWDNPKFTTARAYLYALEDEAGDILENGKLNKTVTDKKGVTLTKGQVDSVLLVVRGKIGKPFEGEFCYVPHHGIVFYDENNKPVACISICFNCKQVETNPEYEREEEFGIEVLKAVMKSAGVPVPRDLDDYAPLAKELKKKKKK